MFSNLIEIIKNLHQHKDIQKKKITESPVKKKKLKKELSLILDDNKKNFKENQYK